MLVLAVFRFILRFQLNRAGNIIFPVTGRGGRNRPPDQKKKTISAAACLIPVNLNFGVLLERH